MKPGKAGPAMLIAIGGSGFRALARLRGLRYSGTERLGLLETIMLARAQGEAYKAWCSKPTPIRRVQVWAQGHAVMTVEPDKLSNLKSFRFDVPSPQNAVIQIVKADEGESPVVLSNVPLESVLRCGLDEITPLPNGQEIRLKIVPEEFGRFDIMVAFAPERERLIGAVPKPHRLKRKAAGAGNGTLERQRTYVPTLLEPPRINRAAFACGFAILAAVIVCGIVVLNNAVAQSPFGRLRLVLRDPPASQNTKLAHTENVTAPPSTRAPVTGQPHTITVRASSPTPVQGAQSISVEDASSCSAPPRSNAKRDHEQKHELPPQRFRPEQAVAPKATVALNNGTPVDASEPQVVKPLSHEGEIMLASARYIRVGMDRSPKAEQIELSILHASFVSQLKIKSRWHVANTHDESAQAAALFTVGFEPDAGCLGVVTVNVTDLDGNLLWKAYINCKSLQKQDHGSMFADAAARLIAKLQEPLKSKDDSGENGN
jgi:hypothetical protein